LVVPYTCLYSFHAFGCSSSFSIVIPLVSELCFDEGLTPVSVYKVFSVK
jgi:hypothetical protein